MKKILLIIILANYLFGCANSQITTKDWHISPPRDPIWSELFISIPYTKACKIKPTMTRKQVKKLIGGHISSTIKMPNYPFFITKNKAGDLIEVAVKMTKDDKVEDVSFKKIWTAKQLDTLDKLNKLNTVDGAKVY